MEVSKRQLIECVNTAISLLDRNQEEAVKLLHPYVPVHGPVTIDYGIYTLQYALLFGEDIQKHREDFNNCMPVKITDLFEQCKTKNFNEYLKLINWIYGEMKSVHVQMKRSRVNLLMDSALYESLSLLSPMNPEKVKELVLSLQINNPSHHLLANTYKDSYEISFFLCFLGNLIVISKRGKFSKNPYKNLVINGKSLSDKKGRLIKGNVISWLVKNSDPFLKRVINSSYNNILRNLLGGHNDYIYDSASDTYVSKDGKLKFNLSHVFAYLSNLELLQSSLRLDGITRYFEDTKLPAKMSEVGFMDWRFSKDLKTIFILQNWANFSRRKLEKSDPPKIISFYRLPIKRKGKYVCLGFNKNYIFPYDLRVKANDDSLRLMEGLMKLYTIKVAILSIAPKVKPFTNISTSEVEIEGKKFLITKKLETEMEIKKNSLTTLIDYLKGEQTF